MGAPSKGEDEWVPAHHVSSPVLVGARELMLLKYLDFGVLILVTTRIATRVGIARKCKLFGTGHFSEHP